MPSKPDQTWLVTGAAGFIGSNLVETLLGRGQRVVGLDDFSIGHKRNLDQVRAAVPPAQWKRFEFIEGDICDAAVCQRALRGADVVLHQAAIGSVPRSFKLPEATHRANVTGFLTLLAAARDAGVRRFVYASSSAVYGDDESLPKMEGRIGRPLSPYAATKLMNEIYAEIFGRCYGMETVGLRYFNVFGPRQDVEGAYAAVIPAWIAAMIRRQPVTINGDGLTSRDFCHVADIVHANLAAGTTDNPAALNQIYNVALGERTTLNQLFEMLRQRLAASFPWVAELKPEHRDFRPGDIRHSWADISKAERLLGFKPARPLADSLNDAVDWHAANFAAGGAPR